MPPDALRNYLIHGLEATPLALERILEGFEAWDDRLAPDRFSAREMIAHLADWEEIWRERIRRTVEEDCPSLPDMDEGAIALERNYATQDPIDNLQRFAGGRALLVEYLRPLPIETWTRTCVREGLGLLDCIQLVGIILGHDGYHVKQALDFCKT